MVPNPIVTEFADARFVDLDALAPESALAMLWESQLAAVAAVGPALPAIAAAVHAAAMRLRDGGRLIYTGAGTSGRIAVQDGAELWPTFGWPDARLLLLPAGGSEALWHAIESAEDDTEAATALVQKHAIGGPDVVLGVAASGSTPYTLGLLSAARKNGALTIGIANNPGTGLLAVAEFPILAATGAEAIAGSTRLKAGTAQKVILNLFSTLLMIGLNRVYRGRMVDLEITSAKLGRRARRMVSELAGVEAAAAAALLLAANGSIKRALLLARGLQPAAAENLLERHRGNLRTAIAELDRAELDQTEIQQ
ncbi:MAG: N-acetylmuramic acid 6-phosphate etherase [Acetobacteraceae bacterium]